MNTLSLWQIASRDQMELKYPSLQEDIEVDVAIVGGGITGLTAASYLLNAGKKVAILETNRIGDGTTGNSTGNLYIQTQPYYQNIKKKFGLEIAKAVAHSRKNAITEIERNVREHRIECNFSRRPWFMFVENKKNLHFLDKEVQTLQQLEIDIDYTDKLPLPFKCLKAANIMEQARFNPLKYLLGFAESLHKSGCLIFEHTKVTQLSEDEEGILRTANGKVRAKKVILATHTPIGINSVQIFTAPYRSYVVAAKLKNLEYPEGHFWGIGEDQNISSTHSISSDNKPDILLVAGRHHKTGQTSNALGHFKALEQYLKKQIPDFEIVHQWSAQHYLSADDIPYIGLAHKSAKNIYMATGYFADGLIYGTIAGKILSDLIVKEDNELNHIYNSNRSTLSKSFGSLIKENTNVFLQYLKDLPITSSIDYDDLKPGDGRIVEIDSEKCAVSRDAQNHLHIVSAVCTHMKCIVNWNNAEKTWDCPCHGSRFSQNGKVIEGPAIADLQKKNISGKKS